MSEQKDLIRFGHWTVVSLWIWLACDAAYASAALYVIKVLGGFGDPIAADDALAFADTLTGVTAIVFLLASIVSGIAVLRWIFLANRNAHGLSNSMTISPGWAVGWFFIPVAWLWKPFVGVRETWQATVNPTSPTAVPVPSFLRWWWGLWIATSILSQISFRVAMAADTPDKLIFSSWIDVISWPLDLFLSIVLVKMIVRLSALQQAAIETAPTATA